MAVTDITVGVHPKTSPTTLDEFHNHDDLDPLADFADNNKVIAKELNAWITRIKSLSEVQRKLATHTGVAPDTAQIPNFTSVIYTAIQAASGIEKTKAGFASDLQQAFQAGVAALTDNLTTSTALSASHFFIMQQGVFSSTTVFDTNALIQTTTAGGFATFAAGKHPPVGFALSNGRIVYAAGGRVVCDGITTRFNANGELEKLATSTDDEYEDGGEAKGKARTLGNTDNFSMGFLQNNIQRMVLTPTEMVFNDTGLSNYGFRIEGDTVPNLFVIDPNSDSVVIGNGTASFGINVPLEIHRNVTAGSTAALINSLGDTSYQMRTASGTQSYLDMIEGGARKWSAGNDGTDSSKYKISTGTPGVGTKLTIDRTTGQMTVDAGTIINESGADSDTRIESTSSTNALFIDASTGRIGFRQSSPATNYHFSGDAGSVPGLPADVFVVFNRSSIASQGAALAIISGNTGGASICFGDTDNEDQGGILYTNNDDVLRLRTTGSDRLFITSVGRVGVNTLLPGGQLESDQDSASGAIPSLKLTQADVSEEFMRFQGTAAPATLTQSIVDEVDVKKATIEGFIKIHVIDDGNQIADQDYFLPIMTLS